jgi:PIN domain nuclease of toxin-antitoxin system
VAEEVSAEQYLLDTHVWIWLMTNSPSLKDRHHETLALAQQRGALYLSAISIWEVARLESEGATFTRGGVETWMDRSLGDGSLLLVDVSVEVLIASTRLPGDIHGDPADRMLAATARVHGFILMTHDDLLLKYAKPGHLLVHKV